MTTMTDSEALAVLDHEIARWSGLEHYADGKKLIAARAHIAEALRGREWRPIESAPKDGTKVIGCAMQPPKFTPEHVGAYWTTDSKQKRWTDGEWSVFLTHWMLLPEPPK